MQFLNEGEVLVIGCGNMGGSLLERWTSAYLSPSRLWIEDPYLSDRLQALAARGAHVNEPRPVRPGLVLLAVKPQMMADVLQGLAALPLDVPVFSIAAGISLAQYEAVLGSRPIIRVMPNTPALIGRGMTAIIGNGSLRPDDLALAASLFSMVGEVVLLDSETQIDAVTAISGSGPAYVFLLGEALEEAGRGLGLPDAMARQLVQTMIAGAAEMMALSDLGPDALRRQVTSPNGTTTAALSVLMEKGALSDLLGRAVTAAHDRSIALNG